MVTVKLVLTLSGSLAVMAPQHREAQEKLGGAQRQNASASPPQHTHTQTRTQDATSDPWQWLLPPKAGGRY